MKRKENVKQGLNPHIKQLIWGLAFAIPFTIFAIWDTYQVHTYDMGGFKYPPKPKVDYELIFDFETDEWKPLRRGTNKPLDNETLEKAKSINFDSIPYDPELDPLQDSENHH